MSAQAHQHLTAPAFSDHFFVIIRSSPGKVAAVGIHEAGILSTHARTDLRADVRMSGCQDVGCRMSLCSAYLAMLTPDPDQYFLFHSATALSRQPRDMHWGGWNMTGVFNSQQIRPVYLVMLVYFASNVLAAACLYPIPTSVHPWSLSGW